VTPSCWLILVEASVNVDRKSDSYYAALYHRIAARRGKRWAMLSCVVLVNAGRDEQEHSGSRRL